MPSPLPAPAPARAVESIRTLALVGPAAAGKTSLAEALLATAGAIGAPGTLERGTTVSDFDAMERRMQHSLNSSVLHLAHGGDPHPLHRHAGRPRLPRPEPARARGGGDRGGGHQRRDRRRADGGAHDGARGARASATA